MRSDRRWHALFRWDHQGRCLKTNSSVRLRDFTGFSMFDAYFNEITHIFALL